MPSSFFDRQTSGYVCELSTGYIASNLGVHLPAFLLLAQASPAPCKDMCITVAALLFDFKGSHLAGS